MTKYHAVMIGEDGMEFGVTFNADTREAAYEYLEEQYPESRCDQLEDPQDTARREQEIYNSVARELDGDDDWDDWDDYSDDEREEMQQRRAEAEEAAAEMKAGYYM